MKTKRNAKKNRTTRNNVPYTPDRNVFGGKAETHLVVLERETAFQQMMDCICQLNGSEKEFTFDMRCFIGHEDELEQVMAKVQFFLEMKTRMQGKSLYEVSGLMANAS